MSILSPAEINNLLTTDEEFRAEFVANPKPFLAQFGEVYPDSTKVHIVETSPEALALIIGTEDTYHPEQLASMPATSAAVVKRSFVDPEFKALLIADPAEAIFVETGHHFPESTKVTVYISTPTDVYLPLPPLASRLESAELSDLELEEVSGGSIWGDISHFVTSTIPSAATTAASAVTQTATTVGNDVAHGATTAGNAIASGATTAYNGTVANSSTIYYAGRAVQFTAQAGALIAEGLGG